MNRHSYGLALFAALAVAGGAYAQPSGGPDAKGNAPVKAMHTVNDGSAKAGANSFTQGQARQHILNSGYSSVTGLTKGPDGVWRGSATKGGAAVDVALDFKGNVSESGTTTSGMAAPGGATPGGGASEQTTTRTSTATSATDAGGGTATMHRHHRRHRHGRRPRACGMHGVNGAACSGIDRNGNGISDKEDRAAPQ